MFMLDNVECPFVFQLEGEIDRERKREREREMIHKLIE